ncbi:MAG: NADH-quinone oxidoreductase subunit F [Firmicutes bacterium]|nr:NADH-quinone oxidoreductase subunit F [Bacillota bacterium]
MSAVTEIGLTYAGLRRQAEEKATRLKAQAVIRIGSATCGLAAGAAAVKEAFEREISKRRLPVKVLETGCLGHCHAEPLVIISRPGFPGIAYGFVDEDLVELLVKNFLEGDDPCYEYALAALDPNDVFPTFEDFPRGVYEKKIISGESGIIDPKEIEQYLAGGGYGALAEVLARPPQEVIREIKGANLRGRGGAGFPAGVKWELCDRQEERERFIICNGDEGDPGAFMDRSLLESNPHLCIEGMIIGAYAIQARQGYIYIRAEYPLAIERVNVALNQAREKGLLGESILNSGFSFDLEVFQGSGAFVCGESSALVRSMEGERGVPRHRPPRLTESGFRGKPTLLNNVKTFCYVPPIIRHGKDWFKGMGTASSPGTALFSLVGKVAHTGLVEVPMGTTLRELVFEVGGGIPDGKQFKAVQIGGPSGGCLPESALDIPIDYDSLHEAGAIMGSGGLVVMDDDDCMVAVARYFLEFTQQESCGQCTFCRLGTRHMLDLLTAICQGKGDLKSLDTLKDLAEDIKAGSLCGLGKTAPNPVLTTLRYFREEYVAHIREGICPAKMCPDLIVYYIEPEKCSKLCNVCVGSCPVDAIYTREDGLKAIDQKKCVKCDNCLKTCPPQYQAVIKLSPPEKLAELEGKK